MRYQDDTKAIAASTNVEDLKSFILIIGSMFPSHIPINIDCFHIYGSFLDVTFLRCLSDNSISTLVKKKFTSPSTILPSQSMTPSRIKYTTLLSELLRIRGICSKEIFISIFDELLAKEFKTKGYPTIDSTTL